MADDEDKGIVWFCMWYYIDKDDKMQNFIKNIRFKVLWKTLLLMLSGNKQTWNKKLARFKHKPLQRDWTVVNNKNEHILNNQRGDLLSVCVLPEGRGKGYAQSMMEAYLAAMKAHGRKLCLLSVKTDNVRERQQKDPLCSGLAFLKKSIQKYWNDEGSFSF